MILKLEIGDDHVAEPMVEVFIYETRQFLEQLEQISLASEENGGFSVDDVN